MEAEIKSFDIKALPYRVRFGLGSTEPIKRWARFEIRHSGDLYWTRGIDVRKDFDSSNIHTSIHKSGEIFSSRYYGKGEQKRKYYSCKVGEINNPFRGVIHPYQVVSANELFEPGYLYYGLPTLTEKDKNRCIACLDELLVNSRLYSSITLLPWINEEEITTYLMTKQGQVFIENDSRCHLFIFYWERVSIAVIMRFTDGDSPIDIQKVVEADKNIKPLKRLFHHETLRLSESVSPVESKNVGYDS